MLAKIFGSRGHRAELVDHNRELSLVKTERAMDVGSKVSLKLGGLKNGKSLQMPMLVASCRELESGGYLVAGNFQGAELDLKQVQTTSDVEDPFFRSAPRVSCHLCVLSRDLPGFRAMTVDLSEGGMQLEVSSKVEVGSSVLLRLEFDTEILPVIEASARVAWCSQQGRGLYRVGLQFNSISDSSKEIISRYRHILTRRAQTDIQVRTVVGDYYLSNDPEVSIVKDSSEHMVLDVLQWQTSTCSEKTSLTGYMRAGSELVVRIHTQSAESSILEYTFTQPRALRDRMPSDGMGQQLVALRFADIDGGFRRFQFLGADNAFVLEVEAVGCKRTL